MHFDTRTAGTRLGVKSYLVPRKSSEHYHDAALVRFSDISGIIDLAGLITFDDCMDIPDSAVVRH